MGAAFGTSCCARAGCFNHVHVVVQGMEMSLYCIDRRWSDCSKVKKSDSGMGVEAVLRLGGNVLFCFGWLLRIAPMLV